MKPLPIGGFSPLHLHLQPFGSTLQDSQVGVGQLQLHGGHVSVRVHTPFLVGHRRVMEGADHHHKGIRLLEGVQGLAADALGFACSLRFARSVQVPDLRGYNAFRLEHRRQCLQPRVGHLGYAEVRFAGGAPTSGRFDPASGKGLEHSGLTALG